VIDIERIEALPGPQARCSAPARRRERSTTSPTSRTSPAYSSELPAEIGTIEA
jgi:hypothetical protein